jgi:hypothetical protein
MIINFIHILRTVPAGGRRQGQALKKKKSGTWMEKEMRWAEEDTGGAEEDTDGAEEEAAATTTPSPSSRSEKEGPVVLCGGCPWSTTQEESAPSAV